MLHRTTGSTRAPREVAKSKLVSTAPTSHEPQRSLETQTPTSSTPPMRTWQRLPETEPPFEQRLPVPKRALTPERMKDDFEAFARAYAARDGYDTSPAAPIEAFSPYPIVL